MLKYCSIVVALMCFAVGCARQDSGPLNAANDEISKLKAELQRTTNQLHEERAEVDNSETKMFAAETSERDAEGRIAELIAENRKLRKAIRTAQSQLEKPRGQ